jgi:hypothetical protein
MRLAALSAAPGTSTLMETELQSLWFCDLPEDISPLSINGSHGISNALFKLGQPSPRYPALGALSTCDRFNLLGPRDG